ncbi:MAG: flagellar filament capping protein FliD [Chromatiales bacterium]|jgi:flagellar hook-associated protein 2|nr:flagellar filament capping protein FliD [Chromatiales bacterium]
MVGISVSGIGSGLDINSLVTQLVAAQGQPAARRLDVREAGFQARISAYGALKSSLSDFRASLSGVRSAASFAGRTASSTDTSAFTASAGTTAANGTYSVEVTQLAQSHKLASKAFAATGDVVGEGQLTIRLGTFSGATFTADPARAITAITIDSSNNTVAGIRDAVNAAGADVQASIVNDGTGQRLVFSSISTGAASSLEITVSGDTDTDDLNDAGLSQLAYDPTATPPNGKNLTQTAAALDSTFKLDGLAVTQDSNTVTGVIEGVTLNLAAQSASGAGTLTVSRDRNSATAAVENFVDAFNELVVTFQSLGGYDAGTRSGGVLQGDAMLRAIEANVRRITSDVADGLSGSTLRSLTDIGIRTAEGGTLTLDSTALSSALDASPDALLGLFGVDGRTTDSSVRYVSSDANTQTGQFAIAVTQLATRGAYTGMTANSLVIDGSNDSLSIAVDGVSSGTISLTQKTYGSGAELAAEIQARLNSTQALTDAGVSLSVSFDTNHYEIVSSSYGSASAVSVAATGANSAMTLGIGTAVGASAAGLDVVGTIDGVAAAGSGRQLTGTGLTDGLVLEVLGGATGARGSVTFSRGIAERLDGLLGAYLDGDAPLDSNIDGLNDRVAELATDRAQLQRRLEEIETRLRSQFAVLDGLLSQLQSTSAFLSQQLSSVPTPGSK